MPQLRNWWLAGKATWLSIKESNTCKYGWSQVTSQIMTSYSFSLKKKKSELTNSKWRKFYHNLHIRAIIENVVIWWGFCLFVFLIQRAFFLNVVCVVNITITQLWIYHSATPRSSKSVCHIQLTMGLPFLLLFSCSSSICSFLSWSYFIFPNF